MAFLTRSLLLALVALLVAACATTQSDGTNDSTATVEPGRSVTQRHLARKVTGVSHATLHYARSVYENPVNRPVSHITSLASLAVQSTRGFVKRAAIGTLGMPALSEDIPALSQSEPMDLNEFERILDRETGTRSELGRIRFLVDGDEYFCRLMSAIAAAEQSIDIRTYIFDNDDFAVAMADQLREKSADVRVRILLDGIGTMLAMQTDAESMPEEFEVPLSMRSYLERDSEIRVRNLTNPWFTGDHTKTTIIDERIAFVGGMNIGREYRYDWHDLMMEVTGPVVDQLQFESDKAWARGGVFGDVANFLRFTRGKQQNADRDGYPVRILQTRSFDAQIKRAQIAAIRNSNSYILIENAYFSDDETLYELAKARRRGVDVRIIIPSKGNHGPLNASNLVTINKLLANGIRVYEYPGMSHVKAAIFDGWASVGSANFDKLSLEVNKELNLATSDPGTVEALLEQVFIPDLMVSREIDAPVDLTLTAHLAEFMVDELL
ncbi:MAG TPA: phosphatidylserine/phosphatidylglycerophosphate/cardiolipin synthase family protein [Woeseiaceae bacterium]